MYHHCQSKPPHRALGKLHCWAPTPTQLPNFAVNIVMHALSAEGGGTGVEACPSGGRGDAGGQHPSEDGTLIRPALCIMYQQLCALFCKLNITELILSRPFFCFYHCCRLQILCHHPGAMILTAIHRTTLLK